MNWMMLDAAICKVAALVALNPPEPEPGPMKIVVPRVLFEQLVAAGANPDDFIVRDGLPFPVRPLVDAPLEQRRRRGKGERKAKRHTRWSGIF